MRLFDFLYDVGGSVTLQAVKKPTATWSSAKAVMQDALKHEKGVSKAVNELYALAVKEKDYPTQVHLQWLVNEQVEEEKTLGDVLAKMKPEKMIRRLHSSQISELRGWGHIRARRRLTKPEWRVELEGDAVAVK